MRWYGFNFDSLESCYYGETCDVVAQSMILWTHLDHGECRRLFLVLYSFVSGVSMDGYQKESVIIRII